MGGYSIVVRRLLLLLSGSILLGAGLLGCGDSRRYVDQEELFFINIGKLEHSIDLFQSDAAPFSERSDIYMFDGLVWVLNRNANKIMTFTSYGDLVSLIYDPDENPVPSTLPINSSESSIASRRAVPYEFNQIGWFAVDSTRRILVEDLLPRDRWVQEDGQILNRVVLRFSPQGQPLDYIGQDGLRGTPFPHIHRVDTSVNDELVVISRVSDRWLVYWFLPSGEHLSTVEIPVERLPIPSEGLIPSLQDVVPDPEQRRIYLKIDYYRKNTDHTTDGIEQISQESSNVYWLDLADGVYREGIEIPRNTQETTDSSLLEQQTRDYSYKLVGATGGQYLLFMSEEEDDNVQLMLMDTSGRVVRRRYIHIPGDGVLHRRLRLSGNNILVGLLAYNDGAEVHWWRTDAMLPHIP
ncbi:MAG: LIC_12708 family protein [Spirochaeta sp.]